MLQQAVAASLNLKEDETQVHGEKVAGFGRQEEEARVREQEAFCLFSLLTLKILKHVFSSSIFNKDSSKNKAFSVDLSRVLLSHSNIIYIHHRGSKKLTNATRAGRTSDLHQQGCARSLLQNWIFAANFFNNKSSENKKQQTGRFFQLHMSTGLGWGYPSISHQTFQVPKIKMEVRNTYLSCI